MLVGSPRARVHKGEPLAPAARVTCERRAMRSDRQDSSNAVRVAGGAGRGSGGAVRAVGGSGWRGLASFTALDHGEVAATIGSWGDRNEREVTYWIGRSYWAKGSRPSPSRRS